MNSENGNECIGKNSKFVITCNPAQIIMEDCTLVLLDIPGRPFKLSAMYLWKAVGTKKATEFTPLSLVPEFFSSVNLSDYSATCFALFFS